MSMNPLKKEKKFIRGFFNEGKYGFRMKIHKDAIEAASRGEWKPVGDYYQIEVGKKRDGTGYYMAEDDWAPDPKFAKNSNSFSRPAAQDDDDLPF